MIKTSRRALIFFLVILCNTAILSAQVATPPLDPTVRVKMPAASSWRYVREIKDQNKKKGGVTVSVAANGGSLEEDGGTGKSTSQGNELLMMAKTENVNIEAYSSGESIDANTTYQVYTCTTTCSYSDVEVEQTAKINEMQFNFAYLQKEISYGGFYHTVETEIEGAKPTKQTGTGASLTLQLAKVFFLAIGLENVNETGNDLPENRWNNRTYGVSLMAGTPKKTQIRVEYSNTLSDEAIAESDTTNRVHQKFFDTNLTAEVKMGKNVISLQNQTVDVRENLAEGKPFNKTQTTSIGFARSPDGEGLIYGAYISSQKNTTGFSADYVDPVTFQYYTSSEREIKGTTYRVSLGYNF